MSALFLIAFSGVLAQIAPPSSFEVISIKLSPAEFGSFIRYLPGGRFSAMTWIRQLIQLAYGVQDYQLSGGPAWLSGDRYQIEARAADPKATEGEMKLMVQAMLADRFNLKLRRETKEFPVYSLVIDKKEPTLMPLKPGDPGKCGRDNSEMCGIRTMDQLANWLSHVTGRPVLDQTGIEGRFDVLLNFDTYEIRNQTPPPDYNKPTLFTAIREQLGLRLEPRKASLPVIVVDDIRRPTEN